MGSVSATLQVPATGLKQLSLPAQGRGRWTGLTVQSWPSVLGGLAGGRGSSA